MNNSEIDKLFLHLGEPLLNEILEVGQLVEVPEGTELIREGQYVKVVPIVVSGMIRVFTRNDEKELLLYYIQPKESCVMSFTAGLRREKSKIFALAEENSSLVLIPSEKIADLVARHPALNKLFYQQFDQRYTDLIETINHLLFDTLEQRLYNYLSLRAKQGNPVKLAHRAIANDLGTAREVVSRLVKKLETQGKVKQVQEGIEVLPPL